MGKPGMLQSVGSQRAGHDLATEQQASGALQGTREAFQNASCLSCAFMLALTSCVLAARNKYLTAHSSLLWCCHCFLQFTQKEMNPRRSHIICLRSSG